MEVWWRKHTRSGEQRSRELDSWFIVASAPRCEVGRIWFREMPPRKAVVGFGTPCEHNQRSTGDYNIGIFIKKGNRF